MKGHLLLPSFLFLILSCSKENDPVIPFKSEPSGYPVEKHFLAGSGNQPFPEEPVEPDPTKSTAYRLKKMGYYVTPYAAQSYLYFLYAYDPQGHLIKESSYSRQHSMPGLIREYQDGKLVKMSLFSGYTNDLKLSHYFLYFYENNKLIRQDYYDEHDSKRSSKHYLYARNRLIHIYSDGIDGYRNEYKYYYDSKGRRIKEVSSAIIYITYDDQDRFLTNKIYESEEILYSSTEYRYQQNQEKPSEEVTYDKNNAFVRKIHWTYTPEGYVLEKWYEDATGLHPWELNTYKNGVIIQNRRFDPVWNFSESTRTVYEYERI